MNNSKNAAGEHQPEPPNTTDEELEKPLLPGCEVTEYDELEGQKEWADSLFVQDFTDSVLGTLPTPLDEDPAK